MLKQNYYLFILCSLLFIPFTEIFSQSSETNFLKKILAQQLYNHDIVACGDFTLKNGSESSVYFDFRKVQSYPSLFKLLIQALANIALPLNFDCVCGVPYGAVPIATGFGLYGNKPLIACRKEAKQYGTQRIIEGVYKKSDTCLLIEDVITTGGSILETLKILEQEGIQVHDIIVCLDRKVGGVERLQQHGYRVHALFTSQELIDYAKTCDNTDNKKSLSFSQRAAYAQNSVAKRLFNLMAEKKTNLACAADVTTKRELLELVDLIGSEICFLKTHVDIISDFDQDLIDQLCARAQRYNFLLCEDRKFADIGSTMRQQYANGIYKIAQWADMVTMHSLPGTQSIQALQNVSTRNQGILLIAQMSSQDNLIDDYYALKTISLAEQCSEYVTGFITQTKYSEQPGFLHVRPGINITMQADNFGQIYSGVQEVVLQGADIIIVGRGIYAAPDPHAAAQNYRHSAWQAYEIRINA